MDQNRQGKKGRTSIKRRDPSLYRDKVKGKTGEEKLPFFWPFAASAAAAAVAAAAATTATSAKPEHSSYSPAVAAILTSLSGWLLEFLKAGFDIWRLLPSAERGRKRREGNEDRLRGDFLFISLHFSRA